MRIFLAVVLILSLGVLIGLAQDHSNATEKKAADELTISQPVKIADKALKPGRYRVSCDREKVTFDRIDGKRLHVTLPCKGKQLPNKTAATEVRIESKGEARVVTALLLRGSDVEHTF